MFKILARSAAAAQVMPRPNMRPRAAACAALLREVIVICRLEYDLPRGRGDKLHFCVKLSRGGLVSWAYSSWQRETTDGFTFLCNRHPGGADDSGRDRSDNGRRNDATFALATGHHSR